MPVVAGVIGVLLVAAGAWVWQRRQATPATPGGRGLAGSGRQALHQDIQRRQIRGSPDRVTENALSYGGAAVPVGTALGAIAAGLGIAGGVALGPVFGIIALGAGLFFGALLEGLAFEDYPRVVRDAFASWLSDNHFPSSAAHVDATLFRNALLASEHVWVNRDGTLAVEVLAHEGEELRLSLFSQTPERYSGATLPFELDASSQCKQQIVGWSEGMLDGPSRRSENAAFKRNARNGQLYPIEYVEPRRSWRTRGYVPFTAKWPRLRLRPVTGSRAAWTKVIPDADNVDLLAAISFDRAAHLSWEQT